MSKSDSNANYPTVHIATSNNRIKRYNTSTPKPIYYLKDKQEFQLELYNPTRNIVRADISLNGRKIQGGGLVLKPGERVFLDRYLDTPQKFVYETYKVGNSKSSKEAIALNGLVRVEFFNELQIQQWTNANTILTGNFTGSPVTNYWGASTTDTNYNPTSFGGNMTDGVVSTYTSTADTYLLNDSPDLTKTPKKIETGMIGRGNVSDQSFKNVQYDFDYNSFYSLEYQILPISQKQTTTDSLNKVQYCTNCGAKLKPTFKFCQNCGIKR